MATAVANYTGSDKQNDQKGQQEFDILPGVLAGVEISYQKDSTLTDQEKNSLKVDVCERAARRDYPARLIEVIQAWEAALFYRGFQFLIPLRGGGWKIPGESTGYGPSMQMDLSLLPTNIYSAYAQIVISSLTRSVPNVRFQPSDAAKDAQITGAQSANAYVKVFARDNDLILTQTDAARYLWTDGRFGYWTRYVVDGQRFGWKEDDVPDDIIPETEPSEEQADTIVAAQEAKEVARTEGQPPEEENNEQQGEDEDEEDEEDQELSIALKDRTPNGREVRTCHGKLELKVIPMMANNIDETDILQYETEVDVAHAKGMFPKISDDIKGGSQGLSEGAIARLARQNVKLGMQATYVTSDSVAEDVTLQRTWFRPTALMAVKDKAIRNSLMQKFPDGGVICYAGETFCYARNEKMDDAWAIGQAYSGDGQNRNALGTTTMPVQKRVNNWLDLINDYFVRGVPRIWMDNKAFNLDALRGQTSTPGDRSPYKRQGVDTAQLVFVEPTPQAPETLVEFVKEYIGPLTELLSGGYPALAGGQQDTDTFRGMALQRDQALGRLGPTWHQLQKVEAASSRQAVRWAAKMRKGTINERVPNGETVRLEINDLNSNIQCFPESDENFPETYSQKQQRLMGFIDSSAKNPALAEALYNPANIAFLLQMIALPEIYIPQVAAWEKQLGEIELLIKGNPIPNPELAEGKAKVQQLKDQGADPQTLQGVEQELEALEQSEPLISSIQIDGEIEDNDTEALCCWKYMMMPEGRKAKILHQEGYENLRLHFLAHTKAAAKKAAGAVPGKKPPSQAINLKDLLPGERPQMLAEVGIKADQPQPAAMPAGPGAPGAPAPMPNLPGPAAAGAPPAP